MDHPRKPLRQVLAIGTSFLIIEATLSADEKRLLAIQDFGSALAEVVATSTSSSISSMYFVAK
jgi:dihydroxyacetone kinase DhaKLM complex PTS-EIIA-like component DhaM